MFFLLIENTEKVICFCFKMEFTAVFVEEEDGSVDIHEEDDSLDIKEECMVKKDPLSTTSHSTKGKSKIVGLFF